MPEGIKTLKVKDQSKNPKGPPKGATILSKETNVDVEEIENGYLITRRTEYRYTMKEGAGSDWLTVNKKWYSEVNPLEISKNKELADLFD